MGSFSGTCEIVEAEEELKPGKSARIYQTNSEFSTSEKNQKLPVLQLGCKDNLENDINKLFESVTLKTSLRDSGLLQDGTSPRMKNTLKKPITVGVSQSPRVGISEPATLKQALRDLCISKASEMAAMKRLSKSTNSPRVSEVGKIKALYNSVVGEGTQHGPSFVESKGSGIEILVSSKDSKTISLDKTCQSHQAANVTSSSASVHSSSRAVSATKENDTATSSIEIEFVSSSSTSGFQSRQSGSDQTGKQTSANSSSLSNTDGRKVELPECDSAPKKRGSKASASKVGRKVKLQTVSSSSTSTSLSGNRVRGTHNGPRTAKSVVRNKSLNKKKLKQDSGSSLNAPTSNETNNKLVTRTTPLVCERCRCTLESTGKDKSQDSVASNCAITGDAVSSSNVHYSANKSAPSSTNCNRSKAVAKVKRNARLKEQLEFSQSSKSSQECSSGTSTSDESNLSGASCGNRPHMSKDVRWAAIRQALMQHGVLGLRQFNLLKKLGCGDIGTVYLAELIGTNCLFAIKVMDNEFLARRKKISRAQTERDILRILDHPFLPTLYAQFTSDNLSCLVMEYCPGGDLHVLRQKQPGRSFTEPAARFYVAEVLLALEYLHMLGIVYRDLKPENILVREDGHIMLTDFDLSLRCDVSPTLLKSSFDADPARISGPCVRSSCIEPFCIEPSCQVSCFSPRFLPAGAKARKVKADLASQIRSLPQLVAEPTDARSNSFVGTHEYLAPEIIKGEGHGAAVDWWTFGVFLYELLYGRTPFKGSNNEETLANVVLQSLRFPDSPFVSFQARDLIRGLLVKEPENRSGSEKGAAEIKQHPFFEGLNWALIRCAVPPELPELCDFGVPDMTSQGKYFECKSTEEHVEFELF